MRTEWTTATLPGLISRSRESCSAPIDCGAGFCRGCQVEPVSNKPSHFWIGHLGSDATHLTRRAYIGTANGRSGIRERRNRDEVVVISKGCHPHLLSRRPRLSASDVTHDLHASLKALGTDFVDLYLLHFDHPSAQVGAIMERLNRHMDEGKISAIGASNWSHERITSADTFAAGRGLKPFSASSVQFSLAEWTRSPWPGAVTLGGDGQRAAREWYSTQGLPVFAWSSLARGFFSNHYDPKNPSGNRGRWCATYFGTEENIQRLDRARIFAQRRPQRCRWGWSSGSRSRGPG